MYTVVAFFICVRTHRIKHNCNKKTKTDAELKLVIENSFPRRRSKALLQSWSSWFWKSVH